MVTHRPRGASIRAAAARDLARSGSRDARVEIVDYDPGWAARFEAERARLTLLLPSAPIHHIGSAAVPGLATKPIIDLMARLDVETPHEDRPCGGTVGRARPAP